MKRGIVHARSHAMMLYGRTLLSAALAVLGSRWLLIALGPVDYGIYNILGGVLALIAFITGALAVGSQRHLAFELGRNDQSKVNELFNACSALHWLIGAVIFVVGETVGLWALHNILTIPVERFAATLWVYQFCLVGTVCVILCTPYQAIFLAKQEFGYVALFGLIQSIILAVAARISATFAGDRLIFYSGCAAGSIIASSVVLILLGRARFAEARIHWTLPDWALIRKLGSFSGWTLFGTVGSIGRMQGIALVLNAFGGPPLNAAYGLASQVSAQLQQPLQTLLQIISPKMAIQEASGGRSLVLEGAAFWSRVAFTLFCALVIPLIFEMDYILALWLEEVPRYTSAFCRLTLIAASLEALTIGYIAAVQAVGRIALYQAALGVLMFATLPAAWFMLSVGAEPQSALYVNVGIAALVSLSRAWFVRRLTGVQLGEWCRTVVIPCFVAVIPGVGCSMLLQLAMEPSLIRCALMGLTSTTTVGLATWFLCMSNINRISIIRAVADGSSRIYMMLPKRQTLKG